jgi:beta-aspartyl-peptidase (threonine type)
MVGLLVLSGPWAQAQTEAEESAFPIGDPIEVPDVGEQPEWVIAVHGGAGVRAPADLGPDLEAQYRATLQAALLAGGRVLEVGGEGHEAVVAALVILENSPLFNAGVGGAVDATGQVTHDASIMRGDTRDAGAVAGSRRIRNPILAARAVMEETDNVLLNADGADWFAVEQGLELVDPLHFETERRRDLQRARRAADAKAVSQLGSDAEVPPASVEDQELFGTVGAVVLDRNGTITAGT